MKPLFFLLLFTNVVFGAHMVSKSLSGGSTPRFEFRPEKITPVTLTHCLEWGGFFEVDLKEIEAAIGGFRMGDKVSRQDSGKAPAYWIHIPPLANASQAAQKMRELESLGVTTHTQVQDESQWNNAISMGYFHDIKKAQAVMASLRNKGVRSAVIGARNLQQVKFIIHAPTESVTEELMKLKAKFPESKIGMVTCQTTAFGRKSEL